MTAEIVEIVVPPWAPFWSPDLRAQAEVFFRAMDAERASASFDKAQASIAAAAGLQALNGRACDGCTLCCHLIPVQAMHKPAGVRCGHCTPGKGCAIWEQRPDQCAGFLCNWVMGEGPPDMKPSVTGCVFDFEPATEFMRCHVHPRDPEAWRRPPVRDHIRLMHAMGRNVQVIVQNGLNFNPPSWGIPGYNKAPFDVCHPDTGEIWCRFRVEHLP